MPENPPDHCPPVVARSSRRLRVTTLVGVIVPFLGLVAAITLLWGRGVTWVEPTLFVGMYALTGIGVTVGYHRLFVHRSFETVKPVQLILAVLGSMSVQGPLLTWAAVHRRHHQHSDEVEDPHSPHRYGGGARGVLAGFWHAHMGWIFRAGPPDLIRYVRDLSNDRFLRAVSRLFPLWVVLGLALPTALGGWLAGTWTGAFMGFLWGGLVRIFFNHHLTWSINSVCHLWGHRAFECHDESRNNFLCGVLALGEGWHNNHHAFPFSARHGLRWWQLDLSFLFIRLLELTGLAWSVRVPAPQAIAAKRTRPVPLAL